MKTIGCQQGCLSDAARERMLRVRGEPLFFADWLRAVFIHFEVEAEELQQVVPFELDLDEGRAYVSLVAFTMRGMRPRVGGKLGALLFKPIAGHEFLNVRAYVRRGNETGIYFLAEWLSNPLSVLLAPRSFGLPYRLGKLDYRHGHEAGGVGGTVLDRTNRKYGTDTRARLDYSAKIDPEFCFKSCVADTRTEFLLERYTAFTKFKSCERFFRIWHPPWPQMAIEADVADMSLLTQNWPLFQDALLIGANYSPGLKGVWMGRPQRI